jgi:hypothetical protein
VLNKKPSSLTGLFAFCESTEWVPGFDSSSHFRLGVQTAEIIFTNDASALINPDRFEAARGTADVKWRTNGLTII